MGLWAQAKKPKFEPGHIYTSDMPQKEDSVMALWFYMPTNNDNYN